MKATELKIGDWVSFADVPVKVKEVRQDGVCVDLSCFDNNEEEQGYAALEDLSPIPLTKEMLEKNGWKEKDGKYIDEDNGLILKPSRGLFLLFMQSGGAQDICMLLKDIAYVHELQHLLWALGIDDDLKI